MKSTTGTRPPDRRQFTSPLLTERTTSTQDHACRVCGMIIPAGVECLYRAWHLEYSHVECRWIRDDEVKPHRRNKPGSFTSYWEWRCPTCGLDSCSMREPDSETDLRCARCAPEKFKIIDGARVELMIGIQVPDPRCPMRAKIRIPARTRGYVRGAPGDKTAVVEFPTVPKLRRTIAIELRMLARV